MVYPFLELAHRAWLNSSGQLLPGDEGEDEPNAPAVAELLDRIARAGPEEKVINSLLYWLIDMSYKQMLAGVKIQPWAPEPYILRRAGVEDRLAREMSNTGHLLQLLSRRRSRANPAALARSEELLLEVKEVEMCSTLLASIRSSCADSVCPIVLGDYEAGLASPDLSFEDLDAFEYEALASLLGLEAGFVKERGDTVRRTMAEWRNPELLFRYLDDNRNDAKMLQLVTRWLRSIFGLSDETLRMIRRESPENVRHLLTIPQDVLLRWYSERCPGTSKCRTLFMLGEDAGSCLRIISNEGNRYNRALMGYVLQSHVRALVLTDNTGRVLVRSLIRLVVRSDTMTPVIFCDPMFFTLGYSKELQRELLYQAKLLEEHMQIPVVHAGSILPVMDNRQDEEGFIYVPELGIELEGYVRRVQQLNYDITWVELLEMDGVAPYTYSEELPYDELLQQHSPGVQARDNENPILVVAALPRADSPSAARYVAEREGETAWTMHLADGGEDMYVPLEITAQLEQRDHVAHVFDPNARAWDAENSDVPPPEYKPPSLQE